MATAEKLGVVDVRWDLSAFFSGIDDPKIEQEWESLTARSKAFATQYRGKIANNALSSGQFVEAVKALESLSQDAGRPISYANLVFSADVTNPANGAFLQAQSERLSVLRVELMFFELELQAAPEEQIAQYLEEPTMAPYAHWLKLVRAQSPYMLSEKEEVILEETANTGIRAWTRYYEEVTAKQVYRYQAPGSSEVQELTESDVLTKLRDSDREVRLAAADAFTKGLREMSHATAFTYNTILLDKSVGDRLRGYEGAEQERHLANQLDKATVDRVIDLCRQSYDIVARYYRTKRKLLGLDKLTHVDRYAPLFPSEVEVGWDDARELVLEAFGRFHPRLAEEGKKFFDHNWIDAEPRAGKTGGAFCSSLGPEIHPVILMSYQNKDKDVETLAHELGHGVHGSLSRAQSYFNYHGTLPLAELASIFGEMMVFEKLLEGASAKDKVAMYAEKIEGIFASTFRQTAMFCFERAAHEARRTQGELTEDDLGEIWQTELQAMFGDSIEMGEDHRCWWSYVWHFFGAPFYVYAYAFGELLSLGVYEKSKIEGPEFAEKYVEVLTLGGSKSPKDLMAILGVDLDSAEFWKGGLAAIEKFVKQFEELAASL